MGDLSPAWHGFAPPPSGAAASAPVLLAPGAQLPVKPAAMPAIAPSATSAAASATPAPQYPGVFRPAPAIRHRPPRRRRFARWSFALCVLAPFAAAVWYLFAVAADQFHSDTAFSVRAEDAPQAPPGLLGAITQIAAPGGPDAEILHDFIRSQAMVIAVDRRIGLRRAWGGHPGDPVFGLAPEASIEDLSDLWGRMVDVSLDSQSGLLHVQARAYTAADARAIAAAVLEESARMVNGLSDQARHDAVRFAATDLAEAEGGLRALRAQLADFRRAHRMIDPGADVEGRMGILGTLESELAEAMVARDTLLTYAEEGDHRVVKATRRIEAIGARIEAEKSRVAAGGGGDASAEVVGRYESLLTDLEFAQAAYTQALTNMAAARAEARRQARYVAAHIEPTLAETPQYPRRPALAALAAAALLIGWSVAMVLWYNVRDSR